MNRSKKTIFLFNFQRHLMNTATYRTRFHVLDIRVVDSTDFFKYIFHSIRQTQAIIITQIRKYFQYGIFELYK